MDLSKRTALVTGGASGIGLAIAQRLLRAGSRVIVCGRRQEQLRLAAEANSGLVTRVCDLTRAEERIELLDWATREYPGLDLLVNNAGTQRRFLVTAPEAWEESRQELAINVEAPFQLCLLALPHFLAGPGATIVNVTSGLAFVPMVRAPVYGATKAAFHSFTVTLRQQLEGTPVRVVEILPPAVNTDLGGPGLHTTGTPLDEFADVVMARLAADELEIAYGFAEEGTRAAHAAFDAAYERVNGRAPL